ncbi:F0F1 ATP synthase subunit B [Candidatus Sumerlaeota bacterium]
MITQEVIMQVVGQILSFIIFVLILKAFAWKPILKLLDERRERIQSEFDEIASMKEEVGGLKDDYEKRVGVIEEEAREKIQESVREGRRMAEEIAEKARDEARQRLEKSKQLIELELDKARKQLKEDIINIAMSASEKAIRERMDEEKHRSLVGGFIEELNAKN